MHERFFAPEPKLILFARLRIKIQCIYLIQGGTMKLKTNKINVDNCNDFNQCNKPFNIIGKLIPEFKEGNWTYYEKLYDNPKKKLYVDDDINVNDYLHSKDKTIYFAYSDDNCAGRVVLRKNWNNYCFIEDISVDHKYRRCGVGQKLIDKAQEWANINGLTGLMLETQNNNLITCRFNLKQGFEIGSIDKILYSDPNKDEFAICFYRKSVRNKITIIIEEHKPEWADNFIKIKNYLMQYLKDEIISIEHVGSTYVEGLPAKPIIDIHIVIKRDKLLKVISILEKAGYFSKGDLGITDIYNFKQNTKVTKTFYVHNLCVCPEDSRNHIRCLKFRDYLRENVKQRDTYARIKKESAALHPHNRYDYNKHKEPFILECYKEIFNKELEPVYRFNKKINISKIDELRMKVGWNKMDKFSISLSKSYFYLCCFIDNKLVGFVNVVSNESTDAYIQDLIVDPDYQGKGIGTMLMNLVIDKLKMNGIYMISVLFEDELMDFYKKFGFHITNAGQKETRNC